MRGLFEATRPYRPVLLLLLLLAVGGGVMNYSFLTVSNLTNLLTSQSVLWLVAMGMTFVLVSGGLDLSVGAVAALSGIASAMLLGRWDSGLFAVIVGTALGAAVGCLANGVLVGYYRLPVFVVTLASLTALTGIVQLWTDSASYFVTDPLLLWIGTGRLLDVPVTIWLMAIVFVGSLYVERWTYFGRDVYAVGGSRMAARLAGIKTSRTLVGVYGLVGGLAGFAGIVAVGRIGAATPQVDNTLPLAAIAAALLGGTALSGGSGSVVGTAFGVLFIGGLANFLSISGVPQAWQQVLTGVILLLSVRREVAGRRRRPSWWPRSTRSPGDEPTSADLSHAPLAESAPVSLQNDAYHAESAKEDSHNGR